MQAFQCYRKKCKHICTQFGHERESCKSGWADRDAEWGVDLAQETMHWMMSRPRCRVGPDLPAVYITTTITTSTTTTTTTTTPVAYMYPGFWKGGKGSNAEGEQVEAPRGGCRRAPPPAGEGVWDAPFPEILFYLSEWKWRSGALFLKLKCQQEKASKLIFCIHKDNLTTRGTLGCIVVGSRHHSLVSSPHLC